MDLGNEIAREMDLSLQTINLSKSDELRAKSVACIFSTISINSKSEMLEYLHKTNPAAIIVASRPEHNLDLNEIQEAARCPVIISDQPV